MFCDQRSKKVIITAHCLLNQNSISDGTADLPSQFDKVIHLIMNHNIGIIQLPCPEFACLGLNRQDNNGGERELLLENTRIRNLLEESDKKELLRSKAIEIVTQIEEYKKYGFEVMGLIGVNRSPSCGIETTTINGKEQGGRGVFIRIIEEELEKRGINVRMIGSKTSEEKESLERIEKFILSY